MIDRSDDELELDSESKKENLPPQQNASNSRKQKKAHCHESGSTKRKGKNSKTDSSASLGLRMSADADELDLLGSTDALKSDVVEKFPKGSKKSKKVKRGEQDRTRVGQKSCKESVPEVSMSNQETELACRTPESAIQELSRNSTTAANEFVHSDALFIPGTPYVGDVPNRVTSHQSSPRLTTPAPASEVISKPKAPGGIADPQRSYRIPARGRTGMAALLGRLKCHSPAAAPAALKISRRSLSRIAPLHPTRKPPPPPPPRVPRVERRTKAQEHEEERWDDEWEDQFGELWYEMSEEDKEKLRRERREQLWVED